MKTIYLVRHGQTYLNYFYRIQGWTDAPLTKSGKEVVFYTADKLKDIKFDMAISSDLKRAVDSRNIILSRNRFAKDTKTVENPLFREEFFGYWDGLDGNEVLRKVSGNEKLDTFKKLVEHGMTMAEIRQKLKKMDPSHLCENEEEMRQRIYKAFSWLQEYDNIDNVLLIGHGFLTQLIAQMFNKDTCNTDEIPGNSTVTTLKIINGQMQLVSYGEKL